MQNSKKEPSYISRSALAEKLGMPLKELTQLMLDAGWILQEDGNWQLTAKGEFEGGIYRQSTKYGQYIAWPVAITDHPVLRDATDGLVSASALAKTAAMPARLLNRLFATMGWLTPYAKGWQLTAIGERFGGVQFHDAQSGVPYVMWPRAIRDDSGFQAMLKQWQPGATQLINGHVINDDSVANSAHHTIANGLFLFNLNYRYCSPLFLPEGQQVKPDFYLPVHRICIDYWHSASSPEVLAEQLQKRDIYREYQLATIELGEADLADFDQVLPKQLLKLGVTV